MRRGSFRLSVAAFSADSRGTVILGPNGAGKTTLLLALQGLVPARGEVTRPPRCAGAFAQPAVLRGSTLWNAAVAVRAVLGCDAPEANDRARAALWSVDLRDVVDTDARRLSTGQRQRLALARALACEPQALFLDEPFANVDADGRPSLRALVDAYRDRTGCALVIATSSLADAVALCRVVLVLQRGKVVHRRPRRANYPVLTTLLWMRSSPNRPRGAGGRSLFSSTRIRVRGRAADSIQQHRALKPVAHRTSLKPILRAGRFPNSSAATGCGARRRPLPRARPSPSAGNCTRENHLRCSQTQCADRDRASRGTGPR